jgi:hypothetical protein
LINSFFFFMPLLSFLHRVFFQPYKLLAGTCA